MKEVYKVLIGTLAFCFLLFSFDRIVGSWCEKMYYSSNYGIFHRQIYCLQKSKDDILIMGSSRAAHHYIPKILEDSLNYSCYNAGSDGMCIYYHYGILSSFINRKQIPKLVILDVLPLDVEVSNSGTFSLDAALDRFAPHYGEIPEIDSLFAINGWKQRIKLNSMAYRYNSKLVQIIKCNYIPWPENKGYEALSGNIGNVVKEPGEKVALCKEKLNLEQEKLVYLQKFITKCKQNNIKLVLCYSPTFKSRIPESMSIIRDIAKRNNIAFLNYGIDPKYKNVQIFKDEEHLNDTGAHLYTTEIYKELKLMLN